MRQHFFFLLLLSCVSICAIRNDGHPRILISLFSPGNIQTYGTMTRAIALGVAARRAHCEVGFTIGSPKVRALVKALSEYSDLFPNPEETIFVVPEGRFFSILPSWLSDFLRVNQEKSFPPEFLLERNVTIGSVGFVQCLTGFCEEESLKEMVRRHVEIYREFSPDAVVAEMDFPATLAATLTGIPLAVTYASFMASKEVEQRFPYFVFDWWVEVLARRIFQDIGIGPETALPEKGENTSPRWLVGNALKIVPSIPELESIHEQEEEDDDNLLLVGSLLPEKPLFQKESKFTKEFMEEESTRSDLVFAYLGTGAVPLTKLVSELPRAFDMLNEDRKKDGLRPIKCYVGGVKEDVPDSDYVSYHSFVPSHNILPVSLLTISHGGANSVMQAVLNGSPLLLSTGGIMERAANAKHAARAGISVTVSPFRAESLYREIKSTNWTAMREIAVRLGKKTRQLGGAKAAVERVLKWIEGIADQGKTDRIAAVLSRISTSDTMWRDWCFKACFHLFLIAFCLGTRLVWEWLEGLCRRRRVSKKRDAPPKLKSD